MKDKGKRIEVRKRCGRFQTNTGLMLVGSINDVKVFRQTSATLHGLAAKQYRNIYPKFDFAMGLN
jgi:hypothetical protein